MSQVLRSQETVLGGLVLVRCLFGEHVHARQNICNKPSKILACHISPTDIILPGVPVLAQL
jgi:hypothetical protein